MRRPSLVDELQGKDPQYVQTRINDVLKTLTASDRDEVLKDYHSELALGKDKSFFLASLIDSLFDRKGKMVSHSILFNSYLFNGLICYSLVFIILNRNCIPFSLILLSTLLNLLIL